MKSKCFFEICSSPIHLLLLMIFIHAVHCKSTVHLQSSVEKLSHLFSDAKSLVDKMLKELKIGGDSIIPSSRQRSNRDVSDVDGNVKKASDLRTALDESHWKKLDGLARRNVKAKGWYVPRNHENNDSILQAQIVSECPRPIDLAHLDYLPNVLGYAIQVSFESNMDIHSIVDLVKKCVDEKFWNDTVVRMAHLNWMNVGHDMSTMPSYSQTVSSKFDELLNLVHEDDLSGIKVKKLEVLSLLCSLDVNDMRRFDAELNDLFKYITPNTHNKRYTDVILILNDLQYMLKSEVNSIDHKLQDLRDVEMRRSFQFRKAFLQLQSINSFFSHANMFIDEDVMESLQDYMIKMGGDGIPQITHLSKYFEEGMFSQVITSTVPPTVSYEQLLSSVSTGNSQHQMLHSNGAEISGIGNGDDEYTLGSDWAENGNYYYGNQNYMDDQDLFTKISEESDETYETLQDDLSHLLDYVSTEEEIHDSDSLEIAKEPTHSNKIVETSTISISENSLQSTEPPHPPTYDVTNQNEGSLNNYYYFVDGELLPVNYGNDDEDFDDTDIELSENPSDEDRETTQDVTSILTVKTDFENLQGEEITTPFGWRVPTLNSISSSEKKEEDNESLRNPSENREGARCSKEGEILPLDDQQNFLDTIRSFFICESSPNVWVKKQCPQGTLFWMALNCCISLFRIPCAGNCMPI